MPVGAAPYYLQYHYIITNPQSAGATQAARRRWRWQRLQPGCPGVHPLMRAAAATVGFFDFMIANSKSGRLTYTVVKALSFSSALLATSGRGSFLNEPISVRHFHSRQCLRVEMASSGTIPVHVQDVSGNGIDLIGGQRLRRVERHRAPNMIEEGRGVRPEVADRRDRRCLVEGPEPADQPIKAADRAVNAATFTLVAMTNSAVAGVNLLPLLTLPRPAGSPSIRANVDIPRREASGELIDRCSVARRCANAQRDSDRDCRENERRAATRHKPSKLQWATRATSERRCSDRRSLHPVHRLARCASAEIPCLIGRSALEHCWAAIPLPRRAEANQRL